MNPAFQAALFFLPRNDVAGIDPLGEGNINDTYLVKLHSGEKRILQRLNPTIFSEAAAVIRNVRIVLDHCHHELNKNPDRAIPFTLPTLFSGKTGDWFKAEDGSLWRMMSMVKNSISLRTINYPNEAEQLGKGLGFFHFLLGSLAPERIEDTLPDFHNTKKYLRNYDQIIADPRRLTAKEDEFCADFIERNRVMLHKFIESKKNLTQGVIHGDPKVDNFLFDRSRKKVISLIDLDTIRYGPLLTDIGDALRSCCNSGGETCENPAAVTFAPELFYGWIRGYFSRAGSLTAAEDRQNLVDFVRLIAFELGLRFYSDYLEGNRYFKIDFANHNLLRAQVQFHLVKSMDKQWERLQYLASKAAGTLHKQK